MPTCFVIQPFDNGPFDKLFAGVYSPSITAAGLEPYRVDLDPNADVLIDSIEEGIKSAAVCLADIATDNPNVWYELGFAFAARRPVVMVCSADRKGKYPFDIQHRAIVTYTAQAPQDFTKLTTDITCRLVAAVKRGETLEEMAQQGALAPVDGLTHHEMVVLATLGSGITSPDEPRSVWSLQQDAEKAGITQLGYTLGLKKLLRRNWVELTQVQDERGDTYKAALLTDDGWLWIEENESKFVLRKPSPNKEIDDDVPF